MFPTPMGIRAMVQGHGQIRREQWHGHQSTDNRHSILSVRPRSLAEHLPALFHEHERRRGDTEILIIERLLADCPELYPRCRFNPLREEDIRDVYYMTFRELSQSSSSSSATTSIDHDLTHVWLERLERLIEVDQATSRPPAPHQIFLHRRSNHLFRALAEVSHANPSSPSLGHILYSFFVRHASQIASAESPATLGQWCNAVLRATMSDSQRADCFRRVSELRPELPGSLRRYGRRGRLVAEGFERLLARGAGLSDLFNLNLNLHLERRRRGEAFEPPALGFRSRSAGGMLLGGGGGGGGGEAGLLYDPSQSYTRRGVGVAVGGRGFLSSAGAGAGAGAGVGGGGMLFGGQEAFHELEQMSGEERYATQMLQEEEEEEEEGPRQRLRGLSMGPRYASRYSSGLGGGGMEGLSMLTLGGEEALDGFEGFGGQAGLCLEDSLDLYGI